MKDKRPYSEKRDSEIKRNCIVSGIALIVFGIAFGIIAFINISESIASACIIAFFGIAMIVIGIIMFNEPNKIKQREADENDIETREFAKILKRRERMQRKQRAFATKPNHNLYIELLEAKYVEMFLIVFFGILIMLYLWFSYENMILVYAVILIMMVLLVAVFLNSSYKKLKRCAEEKGLNFNDIESDYSYGEVFYGESQLLGIGDRYTIFVCNGDKHIISNNTIIGIEPFYVIEDMYNNGIYTGSVRKCHVIIYTCDGYVYKTKCAEFAEELIIEAYQKRQMYMHNDFELLNRENYPVYFGK